MQFSSEESLSEEENLSSLTMLKDHRNEFSDESPLFGDNNKEEDSLTSSTFFENLKIPLYGVLYCIVSISAVFINKIILSRKGKYSGFGSVEFLMLTQSIFGICFLQFCRLIGLLHFDILIEFKQLLRIFCVDLLFMTQTTANAYAVRYLSMPMVSLLKNCQVIVVCLLEFLVLHTAPSKTTLASLGVIFFGSICGSLTDLEFNMPGYIAITIAIFSSAMYIILIKIVFKDHKLDQFTLLFWNNVFSIPFFIFLSIPNGAFIRALNFCRNGPKSFWLLLIGSGLSGAGVNITTYMFIQVSSPTSFSVLGVIKKIMQTLLGYILWTAPTNVSNIISVIVGVMGGIMYSVSKLREKKKGGK